MWAVEGTEQGIRIHVNTLGIHCSAFHMQEEKPREDFCVLALKSVGYLYTMSVGPHECLLLSTGDDFTFFQT